MFDNLGFFLSELVDSFRRFPDIFIVLCKHIKFLPCGGFKEGCSGNRVKQIIPFITLLFRCRRILWKAEVEMLGIKRF